MIAVKNEVDLGNMRTRDCVHEGRFLGVMASKRLRTHLGNKVVYMLGAQMTNFENCRIQPKNPFFKF